MANNEGAAGRASRITSWRKGLTREVGLRLASLALVTVLFVFALLCIWQAWVIAGVDAAQANVRTAQHQVVQRLDHVLATQRQAIDKALADPAVTQALAAGQRDTAATRAHALLPHMREIDFYSPTLDEVLNADYGKFGFAKAAQLMALQSGQSKPQVGVVNGKQGHALALALSVTDGHQDVLAYAWFVWPLDTLGTPLKQVGAEGGRLALRVGHDDQGLVLITHGRSDVALNPGDGITLRGTDLVVAVAMPRAPVVLPGNWLVAAVLAALALIGCSVWLWLRLRPAPGARSTPEDIIEEEQELPVPESESVTPTKVSTASNAASAAPAVEVDPSIFRAYDIRGVVGTQLTASLAHALGQAIGGVMGEKGLKEIVVGRDGRLSGPELVGALSDGLRAAGIDVIDIGAVPTPLVYFAGFHLNTGSGVAVTGSHNPPDYNGFKIVIDGETLSEGAIADLCERIQQGRLPSDGKGGYRQVDVVDDYIERVSGDVQVERPIKVVADAGNGIAGAIAPRLLEAIGCEVVPLYCEVDGEFPNHHPDPSDPENLEDLKQAVVATGADIGVAFDGDGDRLGVVTREGEIIFPDRVLMLFARDVLSRDPGATIIYDVKCTGHLGPEVLAAGGSPLMWRTGHSLIKAKMRETRAALAGEMSGHFFFRERWYGFDDGIYSAARLLEILAGDLDGRTPEAIFATLPKGVSTPELKIAMAEGENHPFIERFQQQSHFEGARLTTIDGVRADWPDGWGLVRASNTTPVLVLRFDANDEAALERIKQTFREQLLALEPSLTLGF